MNARALAKRISQVEGKKVNLPIAQIAEVIARLADVALEQPSEYTAAWARALKRAEKRRGRR